MFDSRCKPLSNLFRESTIIRCKFFFFYSITNELHSSRRKDKIVLFAPPVSTNLQFFSSNNFKIMFIYSSGLK